MAKDRKKLILVGVAVAIIGIIFLKIFSDSKFFSGDDFFALNDVGRIDSGVGGEESVGKNGTTRGEGGQAAVESGQNEREVEQNGSLLQEEKKAKIKIHISGEVQNPGIIQLDEGSRIADAIEKAGGLTENADLTRVNLAYEVQDAQKIYIPSTEDEQLAEEYERGIKEVVQGNGADGGGTGMNGGASIGTSGRTAKVNINTASVNELATLDGIGVSIATRIVQYRNENGKFKIIDELKNVIGIGDSKLNHIRDRVSI